MATLTRLGVPGDEDVWSALGFTIEGRAVDIGQVRCVVGDTGWGFDEILSDPAVLGIETVRCPPAVGAVHANGVTHVDHVVYAVRELDAAIADLTAVLGTPPRRRFHPRGPTGPEMAFYRVGEAFIEVVATGAAPALIGLALWSADLDATVAVIRSHGGPISEPKPAVQGGRIASVWHGHLDWGLAVMGR
ncbi:MAG: VOC family protein [Actinomycetia bacterium]|nr:VOC family protein [Actinomycetes bacterium]MCH9700121.1 VOC family protein [Actinomycetes bacterium]MCH9762001.1 VOC family protein [Actinomycetes bacterium]